MKKYFSYSWIIVFLLCTFMGNINVFSYDFVDPDNESDVKRIKNEIYTLVDDFNKIYNNDSPSQFASYAGSLCPNGITVVESDGTSNVINFEEYVAGVVHAENGWHQGDNIENIKAQAIASRTYAIKRTNYCQNPIDNGQTAQVYKPTDDASILRGVQETNGMILQYNGEVLSTEYDAFCVKQIDSNQNYILNQPSQNHPGVYQSIPKSFVEEMGSRYVSMDYCYGHGRGMSQIGARYLQRQGYTYDQILQYYYPTGIEIVMPMATKNWKQCDSTWGSYQLGSGSGTSMCNVGCLVTSAAIVIAQAGVQTPLGENFNPGTFAEYLKNNGSFSSGGAWNKLDALYSFVKVSIATDSNYSASNIQSYLQQGKQVIVKLALPSDSSKTHFVAVSGVEGDKVLISDPGGSCTVLSECNSGKVPVSILVYTFG